MPDYAACREPFDRDGFVVIPDFLPAAELRELRAMMDGVLDGTLAPETPAPGSQDFHLQWEPGVQHDPAVTRRDKIRVVFHLAHTHSYFWRLATSSRMLDLVEALIGPNIRYYTDQTFVKPARHGSEVPWHQDSAYWPAVEPRLLSCWLALDNVTIENGCVRFMPGSHRQSVPHHEIVTDNPNKLTTQPAYVDPSREVPVTMPVGGLCVHHSLALHRSLPNTSNQPRRGMAMIYLPADLEFYNPWDFMYGFKLVRGQAHR